MSLAKDLDIYKAADAWVAQTWWCAYSSVADAQAANPHTRPIR